MSKKIKINKMMTTVMSAQTWEPRDTTLPDEWWCEPKWDGVRGIWTGSEMITRSGRPVVLPEWFRSLLPLGIRLDGELVMDTFEECGLFRSSRIHDLGWMQARYLVWDCILEPRAELHRRRTQLEIVVAEIEKNWVERRLRAPDSLDRTDCPIQLSPFWKLRTTDVRAEMLGAVAAGYEGIVLKNSKSPYVDGRSRFWLKLKPIHEHEGVIIGYKAGSGRLSDTVGAFKIAPLLEAPTPTSKELEKKFEPAKPEHPVEPTFNPRIWFHLSGMTDLDRRTAKESHPIGTIVTYHYEGPSYVKPRFPRYKGIRGQVSSKWCELLY